MAATMAAMVVSQAHRGMVETAARAMPPRRMVEMVEMAEIPARRELVRWEVRRAALELLLARMEPMAPPQPAAAMAAMAERASRRILLVSRAATAATAVTAALMATAAMAAQVATACIPRIRACLVPMAARAAMPAMVAPCSGTAATAAEAGTAVRVSAAAWVRGAIGSAKTRRSVDQVETEVLEAPRFLETLARAAQVATAVRAVTVAQDLVQQRPETLEATVALVHPAALRVPVVQEVLRVQWGLMAQEATAAMEVSLGSGAMVAMVLPVTRPIPMAATAGRAAIRARQVPVALAARQALGARAEPQGQMVPMVLQ